MFALHLPLRRSMPDLASRSHRAALALVLCATALTGCTDGPTAPAAVERAGTLGIPSGTMGFILAFAPAGSVDSVLVGPAAGQPGALTATAVRRDRVLVLAPRPVGGLYRFRVFPRDPAMAEHITLTVVERADSLGAVDAGAGLTVLLTR